MQTSGKEFVYVEEVGPRDGLQNEEKSFEPAVRAHLINKLQESGLGRIQIGSFVNPKLVPQMAGAHEVWRLIEKRPDVRYSALILSRKGLETAIAIGIPHVSIYFSASDTHSRKNANISMKDGMCLAVELAKAAISQDIETTLGIMCAFGCHYEGEIDPRVIAELAAGLPLNSITELALADTTGMGTPDLVRDVVLLIRQIIDPGKILLHLHDTHDRGYDNMLAALDMGVRKFDASIMGLGGCPFIPGAKGNIATERVVEILQNRGFETGIDMWKLQEASAEFKRILQIKNEK